MRYSLPLTLSISFFLFCGCSMFDSKKTELPPESPNRALSVPIGKNWQLVEEPPVITDGRLPFQTEQSLQPEGTKSAQPEENMKIKTTR